MSTTEVRSDSSTESRRAETLDIKLEVAAQADNSRLDAARLEALASVGGQLVDSLDLDELLPQLLAVAREATGARYAALGVLDAPGETLERFITDGIDEETRARIGELPRGHGILGELIRRPQPLRVARIGDHPRSYGFPAGHPSMDTFLGVPVVIRGEVWGNLYLTEKTDGAEFSEADEQAALMLASWAGVAVDHARLYQAATARRDELQRAVNALQATSAISAALGAETDAHQVVELLVKRGRALIRARLLALFLRRGDKLALAAAAGDYAPSSLAELPTAGNLLSKVLESNRPQRIEGSASVPALGLPSLGFEPDSAIVVPLGFRGKTFGVLAAFGSQDTSGSFDSASEDLLTTFAVNAAAAVATARDFEATLRERSLTAAEEERGRWARELHDETLQEMAALKLSLSGAIRSNEPDALRVTVLQSIERLDHGVRSLRHLITELRPAELDQIGIEAALGELVRRSAELHGLKIATDIDLAYEQGGATTRHVPEIESAVYRIVQESLTNIAKHAVASTVRIDISESADVIAISVSDDGHGFEVGAAATGFGLVGIRERAAAVGGDVEIRSVPGEGTRLTARLPVRRL